MKVVNKIAEMRMKKNRDQQSVAEELGVCRQTYMNIEHAKDYSIFKYTPDLAKMFDCKEEDLYEIISAQTFNNCRILVAINNGNLTITIPNELLENLGVTVEKKSPENKN